ncbi:AraC family transcriptional regulator [Nocardia sp. AG03]|uniref:helix-turn-helix domain-containing protein n=1 Tax=Nocardia sp. AG03 TaxID=3025312 RepID=UPI0024188E57|nr:AraC family transcriptional regulator [Nocardia sp. AG03]
MTEYRERAARIDRAVVWTRGVGASAGQVTVFPDGCMDLIWTEGALTVAGPDSRAFLAPAARAGEFVGIRFAPGGAPALLGVPAVELLNQRVDLADLLPARTVRTLVDTIDNAPDRAAALETVAARLADGKARADPVLTAVADTLATGATVAETAVLTGLSARMLHRRSLVAFGYGPKMLARILRFQRALAAVRAGIPAAETAAVTGFADQAHLSREFRDLAGCSVRALAPP